MSKIFYNHNSPKLYRYLVCFGINCILTFGFLKSIMKSQELESGFMMTLDLKVSLSLINTQLSNKLSTFLYCF